MKRKMMALVLAGLMVTGLVGCGSKSAGGNATKVGMVTDAGTIDDKSFNQGAWEGIKKAEADLDIQSKYLKPDGTEEAEYLTKIQNLYDGGFKLIVAPGYKFETAIFKAQDRYTDAKFVLLDGSPNNADYDGDYQAKVADNTVAIFFAEHQSGFLAGLAAALELKEGDLGFIGGMQIPAVQKFNWGFQQGVAYANENYGTNMTIKEENIVYQGTFDRADAGQVIAAQMYDRGVKAIFAAAGGTGIGAVTEAKTRAEKGQEVWVIGVDTDQYADGVYDEDNNKSVILTSATKKIDQASYDMVKAYIDGSFPGGETLTFDASNNGIGIPAENPNLSEETTSTVSEVFEKIKAGELVVKDTQEGLIEPKAN